MGLFSYLRGDDLSQKALTASPDFLETLASRQANVYYPLGGTNLTGQQVNAAYVTVQNSSLHAIYQGSPSVRSVVDYIAHNVAQLGLKLYERVADDERQEAGDHPAAYSLRNPNPQTPGPYWIQSMVVDHLVYGNAYALKLRNDVNRQLTVVTIPPHRIGLVGRSYFSVDAYRIWRDDGTHFDRSPEDIIHWKSTNGCDPRKGESYLETLREDLAADAASRAATVELYQSGLRLPGWLERPIEAPPLSAEASQRLKEDVAAQARASKRRIPIFEEGMAFKQAGVTPEDAELLDARRWTSELVASLYGMKNVPPETEEERQQFYSDVLPPLLDMFASFLNLQVLEQEYGIGDGYYFEFNLDEKLQGPERMKALTSASGRPVLLTNEARAMLDKPPVDGGDELVTPANVIVGDNPRPSPQTMPIQDPNKPNQDGSYRTDQPMTPIPSGASLNGHGEKIRRDHLKRRLQYVKSGNVIEPKRWDKELAEDLGLEELIQLKVPSEMLWERAGFSPDDIDRMRAMEEAKGFLARTDAG